MTRTEMQSLHSKAQDELPLSSAGARDMFESQRALELRKFFAPQQTDIDVTQNGYNDSLNSDGALNAYAETLLFRLGGAHVTISLVDRGSQYFLVGADREDFHTKVSECVGCSALKNLCDDTLSLKPNEDECPCFIINDLRSDERSKHLPVTRFKFFAGTPITTISNGMNIGTMFLFDDKPRDGLSVAHRKLMCQTASNVMRHLETKREAAERRRLSLMNHGLRTFLERTKRTVEVDLGDTPTSEDVPQGQPGQLQKQDSDASGKTISAESANAFNKDNAASSIRSTLDLATEILAQSLELSIGGVVLVDATISYIDSGNADAYWDDSTDIGNLVQEAEQEIEQNQRNNSSEATQPDIGGEDEELLSHSQSRESTKRHNATKVLAMAAADVASWDSDSKVLDGKTLQALITSYPQGNVWYLDEEGYFSSLEQKNDLEESSTINSSGRRNSIAPKRLAKQKAEATMLSHVFHKARQIIFLPTWDAANGRWFAGCFVWSQSAVPVFTVDSEIAYLSSFTNSVMMEVSRQDALTSNQMKSDFISSISHEFRSPLHGILAAAEFIRETKPNTSQLGLISTIQNCSGTLLDTINHVLDYSKINSFEGTTRGVLSNELYKPTNLGLLCEDIITGMVAANSFQGLESRDLDTMTASNDSYSKYSVTTQQDPVEVIVDIERRDWHYFVQPGAIRRIIMNIFGNAQKYTSSGQILVELKGPSPGLKSCNASKPDADVITLHVQDSGRGMSAAYMERKLYHPFSQEDAFSTGIGLGLCIVWKIVNQLGGHINIQSELGKGTAVEVSLPVERIEPIPGTQLRASSPANSPDVQEVITTLREQASDMCLLIHCGTNTTGDRMLRKYCSEWFGFCIVDGTDSSPEPELIITNRHHELGKKYRGRKVLVIHKHIGDRQEHRDHGVFVGHITLPIGPYKLAKSIMSLFDGNLSRMSPHSSPRTSDIGTQTPMASPSEHFTDSNVPMSDYFVPQPPQTPPPLISEESRDSNPETPRQGQITSPNPGDNGTQRAELFNQPENRQSKPSSLTSALNSLSNLTLKPPSSFSRSDRPSVSTTSSLSSVPSMSSTTVSTTCSTSLHILAVDDNSVNLRLLQKFLQKRQSDTIVLAKNGKEAVEAVRKAAEVEGRGFDVIFMDISMPVMDGFEATRLIRSYEKNSGKRRSSLSTVQSPVKASFAEGQTDGADTGMAMAGDQRIKRASVVALTGLASRRDRDTAEQCGFDKYLTKPVDFGRVGEILVRLGEEKANRSASRNGSGSGTSGSPV